MKILLPHERKRLREHAALTLGLSPDKKTDVTKKDVAEFTKELLSLVAQKRQIKHWLLALVEIPEGDKS